MAKPAYTPKSQAKARATFNAPYAHGGGKVPQTQIQRLRSVLWGGADRAPKGPPR